MGDPLFAVLPLYYFFLPRGGEGGLG